MTEPTAEEVLAQMQEDLATLRRAAGIVDLNKAAFERIASQKAPHLATKPDAVSFLVFIVQDLLTAFANELEQATELVLSGEKLPYVVVIDDAATKH